MKKDSPPQLLDAPEAVVEFFNTQASGFPMAESNSRNLAERLTDRIFRRSIQLRYERVMALCHPVTGRRVLDIGCGTGTYSLNFACRHAAYVLGIDVAPRMIDAAQIRAKAMDIAGRCEFRTVGFADLSVPEPFDFVVAMGVLDYVPDAGKFIRKAVDATGEIACFSLPRREGFLAWQRRIRYRRRCPLFMYDHGTCARMFDALGVDYEIERLARDWFVTVYRNR